LNQEYAVKKLNKTLDKLTSISLKSPTALPAMLPLAFSGQNGKERMKKQIKRYDEEFY